MLFNSWEFLVLLAVTLPLYYLPCYGRAAKAWQVGILLVASALFYAWEEPRLLLLLFGSTVINTLAVERILFWRAMGTVDGLEQGDVPTGDGFRCDVSRGRARRWLVGTVALNLAFLAFFKYAGFVTGWLPEGWLPVGIKTWLQDIPLPVGISFYTFQGISLVVDVWRREISGNTARVLSGRGSRRWVSLRDSSFYISFFPQLVAGPIVKAHEFVDQIGCKKFSEIDWHAVRRGLVPGYFLKVFVADNLAEQTAVLSAGGVGLSSSSSINLMSLLYGYSLQIFADFAGYSLIAIGLGALFGYRLPENFRFPYLSRSITEFWRRWHLSLSSWLRDYLYIPLGGNRAGSARTYVNLFLVMFLGGLWHGAAWKFALWGTLHGVFLAFERLVVRRGRGQVKEPMPGSRHWILSLMQWLVTFHLVSFLWLTFMMPDMASIRAFFEGLAAAETRFSGPPIFSLAFYGSSVALYHAWGWLQEHLRDQAKRLVNPSLEGLVHGLMIFLIFTNPGAPRGFIYFQF